MKIPTPEELPNLLQPRGRHPYLAVIYGVAVLAALTLLRRALPDMLGVEMSFLMYVLAVMITSWVGGWVPGIVVTLFAAATVAYYHLGVPNEWTRLTSIDAVRTAVFVVVGFMTSAFSEALHRSRERVEERTRELQLEVRQRRMQEHERAEMQRRKDQFLAILAHELRNPLTPIVNAAAMLHTREAGDAVVARAAKLIDRHARQMVHLIDDLLDAARLERGTFALRRTVTDVAGIIEAAVEHCGSAIADKRQHLSIDMPPTPLLIDGDPLRLVQVVTNLLSNASTYTPEGGAIKTLVSAEEGRLQIVVRDSGQGMAPDDTSRIFEMFERGTENGSTTGLGIGLALVRQIVALHGGVVEATSEGEGRGSTFTVRLPGLTVAEPSLPEQDTYSEPPEPMRKYRILVVDDNPDIVDTLGAILVLLGHAVETAHDGEQALAAMAVSTPDLVIMDVGMPGMSGYEVCQKAAAEPWRDRMTLVAMTGWGRDEDRQRAMDAGFDLHVVKPIDLERLRELLDSLQPPPAPLEGLANS